MDPSRTPVIVATGQAVERETAVAPLDLVERAARAALDQAPGIEGRIGAVSVVNILNGGGRAPATALARRLGLEPRRRETTTIGGNTPQWLVTRAAAAVASGEELTTLIAGGEAVRSLRQAPELAQEPVEKAGKAGGAEEAEEAEEGEGADPVVGDPRPGLSPAELAIRLMLPAHVYPLFESVLAARAGRDFPTQREAIADFLARFTAVAARHPYAWFRVQRRPAELATPGPENRLVAEPYTKLMNAHITVDQAAAVVVTSLQVAREIGCAEGCVFVHSGADANDVWFPLQRPDLGASPGIRVAGRAALAAAGITLDDLTAFDLYSCFPSAVEVAATALGLGLDDPRGLTVTGGLPYFGGPGNNYTTHAIATMVELLREQGGRGLVTGLGWYVTKHSVGIYGIAPPERGFRVGDTTSDQAAIDASALPVAEGLDHPVEATVEAGTVIYAKDGSGVVGAPVVATLDDGRRVAAMADAAERDGLAGVNLVGARVVVEGAPPRYRVKELVTEGGKQ